MHRAGEVDEAFWLVFLATHFGKHSRSGWELVRNIYGALGEGFKWTWGTVSNGSDDFTEWLRRNYTRLVDNGIHHSGFGNHRKYETLDPSSQNGTHVVVRTYVDWIAPPRTHQDLIQTLQNEGNLSPEELFAALYDSMNVARFGRTAKFDYLTMVGKLGLAEIRPGVAYIKGSTGPAKGARLLFGAGTPTDALDELVRNLGHALRVHPDWTFEMQILEDALCNWQKSPNIFRPFRG